MRRSGALLLALGLSLWAAPPATAAEGGPPRPELLPLPEPDLSPMEPSVRDQLESTREDVARLLADPASEPTALAGAFGLLGQTYLLYSITSSAETCFRNAAALAPQDYRWRYYLGVIEQQSRRFEAALESFDQALELNPGDLPSLLRQAQIRLALNDLEAAEAGFAPLADEPRVTEAARYGLGQIALRRGETERAVELFQAVLRDQPEATGAAYQLGMAYRKLGDLERARAHLAIQGRDPVKFNDPLIGQLGTLATGGAIHFVRAGHHRVSGDMSETILAYRKSLEGDPENSTARLALASALLRTGDAEGARMEFEELLRRDPDNPSGNYNLGTLLAQRGEVARAAELLNRAAELAPQFEDARVNLAGLLSAQGRFAEAERQYALALEANPGDPELRVRRAEVLARLGRGDEALSELRQVWAQSPSDPLFLLGLAAAFEGIERPEESLAAYRRLLGLEIEPELRGTAELRLGNLLARAGQMEDALVRLRRAVELLPQRPESHLGLANALGRAGRFGEAAERFGEVLRLDPDHRQARFGRGIALLLGGHFPSALAHLEESLARDAGNLEAKHALARLLATCPDPALRDGQRALDLAREVFEAERSLEHAETVAMALAEVGRFEEAAELQARLVEQVERSGGGELLAPMRRRLERYRQGEPARAPWLGG